MPTGQLQDRVVILHYHLFKNAGTSLDHVLKDNFGDAWVTKEFQSRPKASQHQDEIADWIAQNPNAVAFSSHTIELPPPRIPNTLIIPLIFIRHPIDRIASAYSFERRQGSSGFGSVLARNTTLAGYCAVRLAIPRDRQCRNFHCDRFSRMFNLPLESELERSIEAIRAIPFIGIVEDFYGSLQRLHNVISPHFPAFQIKEVSANVSRDSALGLQEKLQSLREELGDDTYTQLTAANSDDLQLYEFARAHVGTAPIEYT